jgi:predicted RNA-binding Zn-ribbon protein involved in translation (DUF1610 family)
MKYAIFLFSFLFNPLTYNTLNAQSYTTTESKSCGSCNKSVSVNSRVGMTCPHCGVTWGRENTTQSNTYGYGSSYDYFSTETPGFSNQCMSTSNVNLRSRPSTNSSILKVIPRFNHVKVLQAYPKWLYVSYTYFGRYGSRSIQGYVYRSLFNYY